MDSDAKKEMKSEGRKEMTALTAAGPGRRKWSMIADLERLPMNGGVFAQT